MPTSTIPQTMTASVLSGANSLAVEEVSVPAIAEDEVLVEIAAVGVCGSDTHYYRHGRIGGFVVESAAWADYARGIRRKIGSEVAAR